MINIRSSKKLSYRRLVRLFLIILMIPMIGASTDISAGIYFFIPKSLEWYITGIYCFYTIVIIIIDSKYIREQLNRNATIINTPHRYKLLKLTRLIFSAKTQQEIFEQNMADWDFEIYDALESEENYRLLMINIRHIYSFFLVLWLISPIGDLIEFVCKFKK